jgi:hypothetical protein
MRLCVARVWLALSVLVVAVLATGCGRPPNLSRAAQPDWAVSVLGGPVEIALVMRTGALLADPVWGPPLRRSMDKRKGRMESSGSAGPDVVRGGDALALSAVIEVYGAILPGAPYLTGASDDLRAQDVRLVAVLRQVPPGLNPLALGGKNGAATWRPPRMLPSGVAEYAPNPNANGYFLYVLPGGTWVLVDGATAGRAGQVFARTSVAPPLPTFEPDALVALYAGSSVVGLARNRTPEQSAKLAVMEAFTLTMRPGPTGEFVMRVKYTSVDAAKASEREIRDAMAKVGRNDELVAIILAALVSVDLDRDDDVLTMKATIHRVLLDRIARD